MHRVARVAAEQGGQRLDAFLAKTLPGLSRARLQALIRDGQVQVDGAAIADPARRVKVGERVEVTLPAPVAATPRAQPLPLDLLFEDEHLVVLAKPAGLVVHPAAGHADGTLVNALLAHCGDSLSGVGGVRRPGIVHRLDKDVSGVLVVAKHDRAHIGLAAQFSLHTVERVYEAIVWGLPGGPTGRIDRPLGRDPRDRKRMAVVQGGKRAVTRWRVLAAAGTRAARLAIALETGRTHQIRVHLASIGHPIVGDRVYGRQPPKGLPEGLRAELRRLERVVLHARELGFTHPVTGARLHFSRPAPDLFDQIMERLRSG